MLFITYSEGVHSLDIMKFHILPKKKNPKVKTANVHHVLPTNEPTMSTGAWA